MAERTIFSTVLWKCEVEGEARLDFAPQGAARHIDIPLLDSTIEVHA